MKLFIGRNYRQRSIRCCFKRQIIYTSTLTEASTILHKQDITAMKFYFRRLIISEFGNIVQQFLA